MKNTYLYHGKVVTASSKKDLLKVVASGWTKKDLDKLGMTEEEFKKFSDKLKKKTFEVS